MDAPGPTSAFFDALAARLAAREARAFRLRPGMEGLVLRESAVLVPLFERAGRPHVVFTQRPATLRKHAGQFSFPGGGRDPGDASPVETALRETREELGLSTDGVRVLGALDEVPTLTEFRIAPFVGLLPGVPQYRPSAEEVALVLEVPLVALLDPALHRTERRTLAGVAYDVDFYSYGDHVIWGATARILRDLLALARGLPGL